VRIADEDEWSAALIGLEWFWHDLYDGSLRRWLPGKHKQREYEVISICTIRASLQSNIVTGPSIKPLKTERNSAPAPVAIYGFRADAVLQRSSAAVLRQGTPFLF
jgi:hypothetical protein